jgi:hypothetical protein
MGSATAFEDLSRGCGRPSIIWRLTGFDGSHAWLKHHEMPMLFDRELTGLEQFVPALGEQTWWSSPIIIAKDSDVKVLLMTEVEGELLDTTAVTPEEQTTMFRLAGRFASKLHDTRLAVPDGQTNGLARLRDQLNHYLNAGKDSVDSKPLPGQQN